MGGSMNFRILNGDIDFSSKFVKLNEIRERFLQEAFKSVDTFKNENLSHEQALKEIKDYAELYASFMYPAESSYNDDIKTDLANLWFGVTVTRKEEKEKIAILQEHVKAKHYFVTFEPMANYVEKLNLKGIDVLVLHK